MPQINETSWLMISIQVTLIMLITLLCLNYKTVTYKNFKTNSKLKFYNLMK